MRRLACALSMVTALLLMAGCQRETTDGPLAVSGRIFVFNYRVAIATYLVTLSRNGEVPAGSMLEASFENPQGGDPLVARQTIFPNPAKLSIESPPVHCVVKDRPYAVTIRLLDATGMALQILKTTVTSSDDQSILPAKPLIVGPLYAPNPEVFKADGSMDIASETGCPQ